MSLDESNAQVGETVSDVMMPKLAGVPGFEPGNVGTKNRCLTTWRHPNVARFLHGLTVLRNTPKRPVKTLCETLERTSKRGYNPAHCDGQRVPQCTANLIPSRIPDGV